MFIFKGESCLLPVLQDGSQQSFGRRCRRLVFYPRGGAGHVSAKALLWATSLPPADLCLLFCVSGSHLPPQLLVGFSPGGPAGMANPVYPEPSADLLPPPYPLYRVMAPTSTSYSNSRLYLRFLPHPYLPHVILVDFNLRMSSEVHDVVAGSHVWADGT